MSEPNGPPEFKVVLAYYLKQHADRLHDAAEKQGLGTRFIETLKVIEESLRRDPRHFGDPVFRLPALKLTIFIRAVFPLAVRALARTFVGPRPAGAAAQRRLP